jgi:hypothetical protein
MSSMNSSSNSFGSSSSSSSFDDAFAKANIAQGASTTSAGNAMMYVAIGMIVGYLPRFYYLAKLCGYVCCGGKTSDTVNDREQLVLAMNGLIISQILSAALIIIVTAAAGGTFGPVTNMIINAIIGLLITFWWRMDC